MSLTAGILGLGRMGGAIARRLVERGIAVTVFDPADGSRSRATEAGAEWSESAAGVGAVADILLTVLPGPTELESAMAGPRSALAAMRAGTAWIDLTSGDPDVSRRLAASASALGIEFVSAPMGGGPSDAAAGTLTFFVDGVPSAVERCRVILHALGGPDCVIPVGEIAGQAQVAKLLANLLWFGQAAAVTEALLLGQAVGLDPVLLRNTLARSAGASRFLTDSTDPLFAGDYLETFAIRRCLEELETVARIADETATPFAISGAVAALYREAVAEFGDADGELLVAKLLERRAGRRLRGPRSHPPTSGAPAR